MDEKPKSIWKKSITGRTALIVWLAVAVFAVIVGSLITALANPSRPVADIFMAWGFFGGGFIILCLFLVYIVWPLLRFLFWKHWRRTLFGLACFITLIALFYAEEDWRGKNDWEKFKREWQAKGEHFDFKDFVPPPVPDDQNFAMAPIWVESIEASYGSNVTWQWYGKKLTAQEQSNLVDRLKMPVTKDDSNWPTNGHGNWQRATLTDLKPWRDYYRTLATKTNLFPVAPQPQMPAQDVLLALSKYDPNIEELRSASQLPYSRFPLNYDGMPAAILLPHLSAEKRCSQVLQLRAIAELQNDESKKALDDVKLMLRLTDASRTESFLISHLVRIAILQITLQPIYEGLAEHKWSDAQLSELDSELVKLDFLADFQFAIRGERALEIANIEFLRHPLHNPDFHRSYLSFIAPIFYLMQALSGGGENFHGFQMFALGFGPSGWIDQNELHIAQFETKWYLPIINEETKTISQAKIRAADNALNQEIRHRTPENILETLLIPALGSGARKFAYAQSSINLARVAIALERFRLVHSEYPESLDALIPQFMAQIPHDIINGEPLHYRRTDNGQFVLYSVGWNETDDGGVVGLTKNGGVNNDKGDWVWRYPQK